MTVLIPNAKQQFCDQSGVPLALGTVAFYTPGTLTPKDTWQDAAQVSLNANPVPLDAAGRAIIYGTGAYRQIVKDALGNTVWDQPVTLNDSFIQAGAGAVTRTAQNKLRDAVSVKDFGAVGDGVTNDTAAVSAAQATADALYFPDGNYLVDPMAVSSGNLNWYGHGATLTATGNGKHILGMTGGGSVRIEGLNFVGTGSATSPLGTVGGKASTSTGLVTIVGGSDVKITNCTAKNFYSLFVALDCQTVQICDNTQLQHWLLYGILASTIRYFQIDRNNLHDCDQAGATQSYGIQATGGTALGTPVQYSTITNNIIRNVPSWDGIMSHEASQLRIAGNIITGVRTGVDVTKAADNPVAHIKIENNSITATTIDTWAGAPGLHAGIICEGFGSSSLVDGVNIANNTIDGFFAVSGLVISGNSSSITLTDSKNSSITGNTVKSVGSQQTSAGIYITGKCDNLTVADNNLSGTMGSGAIRFANATGNDVSICGGSIVQANVAHEAVRATGSTITLLSLGMIAANSTTFWTASTSTIAIANSFAGDIGILGVFKVNGTQVVGAQGTALPADATDLATALTLLNATKARLRAHGLVA